MSKSRQKDVSYFKNWLQANKPNIEIVKWSGAKNDSVFRDLNTGKEFEYKFCRLRDLFNRNPNAIPCSSKEDRMRGIKNLTEEQKIQSRKKAIETFVGKYGVDNPSKNKEVAKKISKKNSENLEFLIKARKTMQKRYGTDSPMKCEEIKIKQKNTVLKKYGKENVSQIEFVKNKKTKTKIENGSIITIDGKQIKDLANEKSLSYSKVQSDLKKGIRQDLITSKQSGIEQIMKQFLESLNQSFSQGKGFSKFRPDFHMLNENLIIECDGLYWHSDKIKKDNSYHRAKADFYKNEGCRSLFFREDEILNKFEIVQSIIKNKLNLNERIFARKCKISTCENTFFKENHLMGSGSGRIYCLEYENKVVAAIQVKWKNKNEKILEISRFCTKNEVSVVGGYSRLIRHVEKIEQPNKIITFVDLRYGSGEYLESLGFKKKSEHLSFQWTDFKKTYHRMIHPSNSGYDHGLYKIWDCGQRLYEKVCLL